MAKRQHNLNTHINNDVVKAAMDLRITHHHQNQGNEIKTSDEKENKFLSSLGLLSLKPKIIVCFRLDLPNCLFRVCSVV